MLAEVETTHQMQSIFARGCPRCSLSPGRAARNGRGGCRGGGLNLWQKRRCESGRWVFVHGVDPRHVPDVSPPWALTFDLRERETIWTDQNQARLVQFIASDRLEISRDALQQRVRELSILVPDIVTRYASMKPELLAEILRSIDRVALCVLDLKNAFPKTDVSAMIARNPSILLEDVSSIVTRAARTMKLLEIDALDTLIEEYPLFLDPSAVEEVLLDLERLMPGDAKQHLIKNPSLLLSTVKGRKRLGEPADI